MVLIDKHTLDANTLAAYLYSPRLAQRLHAICGYSSPLPDGVHMYYFLTQDKQQMLVEFYRTNGEG